MADYKKEQDLIFQQIADAERAADAAKRKQRLVRLVAISGKDPLLVARARQGLVGVARGIHKLTGTQAQEWADREIR